MITMACRRTPPTPTDGRGRAALSPSRAPRGPPTAFVLPLLDVKMAEQACETCVVRQPILFAAAAECTYLLLLALDADTLEQCLFGTFRIVDAFTDDGRGEATFSLEAVGGAAARLRDINVAELQRSMEFMPAGTGGRQVRGKLGTVAFDTFLAAHVPSDDNHGRGMAGPSSRLIDRVVGGSGGGDAADVSQPRVVLDGASIASTASPQNGGYLNVGALEAAIETYYDRGINVLCLVPSIWLQPRPMGETDETAHRRGQLLELMRSSQVVLPMPDEGKSHLPPLVSYVLLDCDVNTVLVTNDKNLVGGAIAACKSRAAQDAMRIWCGEL